MTEAKQQVITDSEHPLRTYIIEAVESGHFHEKLGSELTFDALQRQLVQDGYSAQSKNTKEVGLALTAAGVTQTRKVCAKRPGSTSSPQGQTGSIGRSE